MTASEVTLADEPRPARRRGRDGAVVLALACVASVMFIIISATATVPTYRVNPIFLIPAALAPYFLRRRLHLHVLHYALLLVAILLHDMGAYGWYQRSPLPFSWDILVHYFFPIPITLILYRALATNYAAVLRPWQAAVASLMFVMAAGALHEIMEYLTYLVLGEEKGMLKPSTSYFFDTQRDLTNNLLGALTAVALLLAAHIVRRGSPR